LRKEEVLRLELKNDDEMRDTESKNSIEYKTDKIQKNN